MKSIKLKGILHRLKTIPLFLLMHLISKSNKAADTESPD